MATIDEIEEFKAFMIAMARATGQRPFQIEYFNKSYRFYNLDRGGFSVTPLTDLRRPPIIGELFSYFGINCGNRASWPVPLVRWMDSESEPVVPVPRHKHLPNARYRAAVGLARAYDALRSSEKSFLCAWFKKNRRLGPNKPLPPVAEMFVAVAARAGVAMTIQQAMAGV